MGCRSSDETSEARLSGEAPQALPVEGVLNPINCTKRFKDMREKH